jgi:16S rRNA (guanine527-N7)-methyltransferase
VASTVVQARLAKLSARFALPADAERRLAGLLDLVAAEPAAITSVRDPVEGVDVHVADSLVALDVDPVRAARRLADLGSGGGFPGLALAIALSHTEVALVESVARKCAFLERTAVALALANVRVVNARAEAWTEGLGAHDVVTARALAPLGVVLEYAAPLLVEGGVAVAGLDVHGPHGVAHHLHLEPQVGGVAAGLLHAVVRGQAGDDQGVDPGLPEHPLQGRGPLLARHRVPSPEPGVAVLALRALVDDGPVDHQVGVELGPPRPLDAVVRPDPAGGGEVRGGRRVPVLGVEHRGPPTPSIGHEAVDDG